MITVPQSAFPPLYPGDNDPARVPSDAMSGVLTADDDTGLRVWDASHLLASLLTGAHGCELAPPPVSILELGAGTGALAAAVASSESAWCAGLRRYVATDLADRLPELSQTILQHGVGQRVTATECVWGSQVPKDEAGKRVTSNPLMLSMVASVFEFRQGLEMPTTVVELYEVTALGVY